MCSGNTAADSFEKTSAKSEYSAGTVTRASSAIRAAIKASRSGCTAGSADKAATCTIKTSYSRSNATFANSFESMIWTL